MAWTPGTSRPEPRPGEPLPSSPYAPQQESADAAPTDAPPPQGGPGEPLPEVRQHGDVDPYSGTPQITDWDDPSRLHGNRPEPATAWQADTSRQSGFGNEQDRKVSWGSDDTGQPAPGDPRGSWRRPEAAPPGEAPPVGAPAEAPRAVPASPSKPELSQGAYPIRPGLPQPPAPQPPAAPSPPARETPPAAPDARSEPAARSTPPAPKPEHTTQLRRSDIVKARRAAREAARRSAPQAPPGAPAPHQAPPQPVPHQQPPGQDAAGQGWAHQVRELAQPVPGAGLGQQAAPGPHQPLPGDDGLAGPWRPPTSDPFLLAAQNQARPAGLGRRFAARLIDTVVTGSVVAAVALPLLPKAKDHIDGKIEQAEQAGVNTQVWLIDGTTGLYLAMVLGALLLFGVFYEALPQARWGRTLGKKLCGLHVLSLEEQEPPGYGRALVRWLVYGVLGVLVVGVVNVLWALFDKPWRQCWHDKAAGTFTAEGGGSEIRLG